MEGEMNLVAAIQSAARRGLRLAGAAAFLPPLATRIVIGLGFVQTGLGKWRHFDNTVAFFSSIGIPFPNFNAGLVTTLELVGGAALVIGLLTRLFATGLLSSMTVALLTADRHAFLISWSPASDTSPTDVASFVFLLFLLWLAVAGPGPVSADHWLRRALLGADRAGAESPTLPRPAMRGDGGPGAASSVASGRLTGKKDALNSILVSRPPTDEDQ